MDNFDIYDLRILKTLISDKLEAFEFASSNDLDLFTDNLKPFAGLIISYIKNYNSIPTKRVILETVKDNYELSNFVVDIWNKLEKLDYNLADYKYDLEKVKKRVISKKLTDIRALFDSNKDEQEIIRTVEAEISNTRRLINGSKHSYVHKAISEYIPTFKEEFVAKMKNPGLRQGIMTGYSFLDHISNGFSPAEMIIVAGETGMGKSLLLNNIAVQMWMQKNNINMHPSEYKKGHSILYFSLEMPYGPCFRRTLSRIADVPTYGIRDCSLSAPELTSLKSALKFIKNYPYPFEIVDIPRGTSPEDVERIFNEVAAKFMPDVVVVDYLGLMEDKTTEADDWLKLGHIAGKLHELARTYNIVMLTAVQLNRLQSKAKNPETHEVVGLHRLGRSSLIAHHANIVIQIESRKDEKTYADLKYHVIKCRDGELGCHTLKKNFANASITELEPYEPAKLDNTFSGISITGDDISEHLKKIGWLSDE